MNCVFSIVLILPNYYTIMQKNKGDYFPFSHGIGSTYDPFFLTSKCTCGPVEIPVLPTLAIVSLFYLSAFLTDRKNCAHTKLLFPTMVYHYSFSISPKVPEYITVPSAAATTLFPAAEEISIPE